MSLCCYYAFYEIECISFDVYIFGIVMSSWLRVLFIRLKYPSVSLQINFGMQFVFIRYLESDAACFLFPFA